MTDSNAAQDRSLTLEQIEMQFMQEWTDGNQPTLEGYLIRYPEHAKFLLDFITSFVRMENAASRTELPAEPSDTARRAQEQALATVCSTPTSLVEMRKARGWTVNQLAEAIHVPPTLANWLESGGIIQYPRLLADRLSGALGRAVSRVTSALQMSPAQTAPANFSTSGQPRQTARKVRTFRQALEECERLGSLTDEQRQEWFDALDTEGL